MSYVVRYRPLDGLGEARLDLDECPRRFVVCEQDISDLDRINAGVGSRTYYLTPDGRWVEHIEGITPFLDHLSNVEIFQEVTCGDIVRKLGSPEDFPRDIMVDPPLMVLALARQLDEMGQRSPWSSLFRKLPAPSGSTAAEMAATATNGQAQIERPSEAGAPLSQPKPKRGTLDERAAIEFTKNPTLTIPQLAQIVGCASGTLYDRKKCPLLAVAREKVRAGRLDFRGRDTWRDRNRDDD